MVTKDGYVQVNYSCVTPTLKNVSVKVTVQNAVGKPCLEAISKDIQGYRFKNIFLGISASIYLSKS